LSEDFGIAKGLGISASPSWIANGRHKFSGVDAGTIQKNFCRHNSGLSGCGQDL